MSVAPTFTLDDVRILDKIYCHEGFLKVPRFVLQHRRFDGSWSAPLTRERLERPPGVGVLLYDVDQDKVLLVEQFRIGCLDNSAGPWVLELVAGMIDTDESPEAVGRREALEEANQTVSSLIPVCEYFNSPGGSSEKIYLYCAPVALGDTPDGEVYGCENEHEDIRTVILSRAEANTLLGRGRINNAMTIIALQWLNLHVDELRARLSQS